MMNGEDRLDMKATSALVQVGDSTIRRWVADGCFPKPIVLGPRSRFWLRSTVECWLADRGVSVGTGGEGK
ncbi:AlpA family phage regulatory protein [Caballeronia sp. LZ032]|uniref:helix-turn-helix transcriptional regulator n=1 Tax=Caballeronia sp. LZ032 TaxID=3038565 RepID=UPI0028640F51|nr:AlpA family phage regulatory protein [Caballeronia sp. LZ032]MDR5878804.1 AlpA family phage regulatory protein [Caballeronia sp. LZ032]